MIFDSLRHIKRVRKGYRRFIKNCEYFPNLSNPKTMNEKLLVRKLYPDNELFSICADKLLVRDYVSKKIGDQYLIPLLKVFQKPDDIDFSKLPNSYVVKAAHGSGWNKIVRNSRNEDMAELKKMICYWLKANYTRDKNGELHYEKIKHRVLVEKLLLDDKKNIPSDYKLHCFALENEARVIVQVDESRFSDHRRFFFSEEWERLPFSWGYSDKNKPNPDKPESLSSLLHIAKILAEPFDYVRVDLYSIGGKIYFGELTFVHESAGKGFSSKKWDFELGDLWKMKVSNDLIKRVRHDKKWLVGIK